jgi:hypothetical protein
MTIKGKIWLHSSLSNLNRWHSYCVTEKQGNVYFEVNSNQKYLGLWGYMVFRLEVSSVMCCTLATSKKTKYTRDYRLPWQCS